jgi:hypothetical protein
MELIRGVVNLLWRFVVVVPVKLAAAVGQLAFGAGRAVGRAPVVVSRRAVKVAGVKGTIAFVVGLVVGLVVAPVPGRQLRAKLRSLVAGSAAPTDADLADAVTYELAHAPRTWHLTQPDVAVSVGRVTLSGEVAHQTARDELVTVAQGIPGVIDVDDRLTVATSEAATAADAVEPDVDAPGA